MGEDFDDEEDDEDEVDGDGEDAAAGEDDEDADGEEDGARKKGRRKLILILLAVLLLLIGGAAAAYFMGLFDPSAEEPPTVAEEGGTAETDVPSLDPLDMVFIETPEILADLRYDGPRRNYLKIKLNFELERPEDAVNMQVAMPRVVDAVTVYLREMSPKDFKGSEGIHRLRQELRLRVNAIAAPVRVTDVLIADFLLQG